MEPVEGMGDTIMKLRKRIRWVLDKIFPGFYLEKYILKDGKQHPVAVICPGGGYHWICSFSEGLPYAKKLNAMGYSAVVVHYRCGKEYPYPTPQDDLARAIRYMIRRKERWNLDMDAYSLWGSSAGGHLVASFGTDAMGYKKYNLPKPCALILSYPVVTMAEAAHVGSRNYLLGNHPSPQKIELTSIERQLTSEYPPTFLWCGMEDQTVDTQNSRLLADALVKQGIYHQFLPIEGVDHGVGIGEGLPCEGWFEKAVYFWEKSRNNGEE